MLANVDLIISGALIVTVCATQPWKTCSLDLLLFFSATAVYALLVCQFKSKRRTRCSCNASLAASEQEDVAEYYQQDTLFASIERKDSVDCDHQEEASTPVSILCCDKRGDTNRPHPEPDFFVDGQIAEMRKFASVHNIAGTMRGFRALQRSGAKMTSTMYNIVLRAWISCGNIHAAEDWMADIVKAGMADLASFNTLIDALAMARAFDKASALLLEMKDLEIQPDASTFYHLLNSCARENRFHDGLSLMESMDNAGILPSTPTLDAMAKVLNGCRSHNESSSRVWQILRKLKLEPDGSDNWSGKGQSTCRTAKTPPCLPVAVPRLVAVIARASKTRGTLCQHEVQITGSLSRVKYAHRTLKQQGFLANGNTNSWPLNGHWVTDHGLTVIIEGKVVRWSRQRASRLRFVGTQRRSCTLSLYGSPAQGSLVTTGLLPGSTKTLRWDNGDCWHSYDSHIIGQAAVWSQTMTKVFRDAIQDQAYRTRSEAALRCVGKSGLGLPSTIESAMLELLGDNMHCQRLFFDSKWNPRLIDSSESDVDPIGALSRRNPRVGIRHCWAEPDRGCFGQRVLVNGEEVDEESFSRHIKIVSTM